jgi:hypothetical protein
MKLRYKLIKTSIFWLGLAQIFIGGYVINIGFIPLIFITILSMLEYGLTVEFIDRLYSIIDEHKK